MALPCSESAPCAHPGRRHAPVPCPAGSAGPFSSCNRAFLPYANPGSGGLPCSGRGQASVGTREASVSLYPPPAPRPTFAATLRSFAQGDALPLQDLEDLCDQEGIHFGHGDDDVWTPAVTLWALLAQCLSGSKSCVAAVARVLVLRVALGLPPCGAGSGAYCKARAKLPESLLRRLSLQVGMATERQAPDAWRWKGRRVL